MKFSFAEVEENEDELEKLRQWYLKIEARDSFGAPLQEKARLMLAECAKALDLFCETVYEFTQKA